MKKTKKHRLQRAEINFVSSLTMEQVATDIASMASERILVDIQSLDADTLTFCVQTRQNGWIHTRLQGTLRRWAGDMMHVVCDRGEQAIRAEGRPDGWNWIELLSMIMLFAIPVVLLIFTLDPLLAIAGAFGWALIVVAIDIARNPSKMTIDPPIGDETLLQGLVDVLAPVDKTVFPAHEQSAIDEPVHEDRPQALQGTRS